MAGFFDNLALPFGVAPRADAASAGAASAVVARMLAYVGTATLRSYNLMADGSAVPGLPFTLIPTSLKGGAAANPVQTTIPPIFAVSPDGNWIALWNGNASAGGKLQFYKKISERAYQYLGNHPNANSYEGQSFRGNPNRGGIFLSNTRFMFNNNFDTMNLVGDAWSAPTSMNFTAGDYGCTSLSVSDDGLTIGGIGRTYANDTLYSQIQAKFNGAICSGSFGLGQSQYWANEEVYTSPLGTNIIAFVNRGGGDGCFVYGVRRNGTTLSAQVNLSLNGYYGFPGKCEWITEDQCVFGVTPYANGNALTVGRTAQLAIYLNCTPSGGVSSEFSLFPATPAAPNTNQSFLSGRMTDALKIGPSQVLLSSEAAQIANISVANNAPVYSSAIAFPYPVALATAFLRS